MKVRIPVFFILSIFVCCLLINACGSPPEQEIMDAEDAVKAAIYAGAEDSSPKLLDRARTYLQDAKMFSEQGNYNDAKKKANLAIITAQSAEKNSLRLSNVDEKKAEGDYAEKVADGELEADEE